MVSCMDVKRGVLFLLVMFLFSISFVIISAAPAAQEDSALFDEGDLNDLDGGGDAGQVPLDDDSDFIDQRDFDCGDFPCDYFDDEGNYIGPSGVDFDDDAVLEVSAGTTPDSFLYFIDEFFDRFGTDLQIREEKIAEIKAMIQEGKIEEAKEALERYKEHAEELEREVTPEEEAEARRSASAIHNTLIEIEDEIPDEDRDDFFNDIIDREGRIFNAAQIAGKIRELCETLSELDPVAYEQTCKTDDDSPQWHRNLDRDLTEEQRQEAEAFFGIMSECFESSGAQCRCDEISITDFAEVCSVVAPLEAICDDDGIPEAEAEAACDEVDELTEGIEDLLPDYLLDVLDELIEGFEDDQFDNHAPRECIESGATTRAECEEIMFDLYAPQECIDAGLTSELECGRLIFSLRAPQECKDAGLTGDSRNDRRECEDIMRGIEGNHGDRNFNRYGGDCSTIQDGQARLQCYDRALGDHGDDFRQRYEGTRDAERQCAQGCSAEGGAWDFSGGYCECYLPEFEFGFDDYKDYGDFVEPEAPFFDCSVMFCGEGSYCDPYRGCYQKDSGPGGSQPWEGCEALDCQDGYYCEYGNCIPFEDGGGDQPFYDCSKISCQEGFICESDQGCVFYEPTPEPTEPTPEEQCATDGGTWDGAACVFPAPVTGGVISGNVFLEYYFG